MCETLITKTLSCEDIETTVSLQVQLTKKGSSKSLREYANSKERQHEECLEKMRGDLKSVDSLCDKQLKELTEILDHELQELDAKMHDCSSRDLRCIEEWNYVQGKLEKFGFRVKILLEEFGLDLANLEKTRCNKIGEILGKYKTEVIGIRFLGIESLESIFERVISDLNSSTLENLTHHEDLKLKFDIEGDGITSKHLLKIRSRANKLANEQVDQLWEYVKTEQVKELVVETLHKLEESNNVIKENCDCEFNCLLESLESLVKTLEIPVIKDKKEEFWESLSKELEALFENVHTCHLNADEQLQSTITNLNENFDNKKSELVNCLRDKFGDGYHKKYSIQLAALDNIKSKELNKLQFWQKVLDTLGKTLEKTNPFVLDVISFWLRNVKRVNEARLRIENNIESSNLKCSKREQESSSKVKYQMKVLKEAPDKNKLEASSKILSEIFTDINDMWNENFGNNTQAINEFVETNVLTTIEQVTSEANDLLAQKYPRNSFEFREISNLDSDETNSNLPAFKCIDHINTLELKALSIREDLEIYLPVCEYEITYEYDTLINDLTNSVNEKHGQILAELKNKTRSFKEVKSVRFAELEIHFERLKSHQAGVNVILNNLSTTLNDIKSDQNFKLNEFYDKLTNVLETHEIESQDQITDVISSLEEEWNSLSINLENRILNARMICQHKFETLKHSNDSFQKIAKHFKNGGNFSQNELTSLTKELKQLEKTFLSQSKTLSDQYNTLMKDISGQKLDPVIKTLREKLNVVELNNKLYELLVLTRMKLRTEVRKLKTQINTFASKSQFLYDEGKLNQDLLQELNSLACSIFEDIAFTLPLECERKTEEGAILIPQAPLPKKEKGATEKISLIHSLTPKSLFTNVTEEELKDKTNILSRAKLILCEKYLFIVQLIQDTLGRKSVDTKKTKKKESKDATSGLLAEHIQSISDVLNSYNKECETVWFNLASKFIKLLYFFQKTVKDLSEQSLDEIHSFHVNEISHTERDHNLLSTKNLNESINEIDKIRKAIVLPLAHPTYKHKLIELYQKAKSVSVCKMNECKELKNKYREDLQKKHHNFVERITVLRATLEEIQEKCFDAIPCEVLTTKLQKVKEFMVNIQTEDDGEVDDLDPNMLTEDEARGSDDEPKVSSDEPRRSGDKPVLVKQEVEEDEYSKYPMSIWFDDEEGNRPGQVSEFEVLEPIEKNSIITMATSKLKDSVERIKRLYSIAEDETEESVKRIKKCVKHVEYDINQAMHTYTKICS